MAVNWAREEPDEFEHRYRELFDPETGLPGELLLRDRLGVSLARARRFNRSVLVVWFEVAAPAVGATTAAARRLASGLLEAVRPDDCVARVGEWQFVVLCNDLAHDDAVERIVRRLHTSIRRAASRTDGGEPLAQIGTALGQAGHHPHHLLTQARVSLRPVRVAGTAAV